MAAIAVRGWLTSRAIADAISPFSIRFTRSRNTSRATKKVPSWMTSAMVPQTTMSGMLTLRARHMASGRASDRMAAAKATAAAWLFARISLPSFCGVKAW